jgi:hypothetical protein
MSETNQDRVERLTAERDTAVNQLAEWCVRTQQEYYERTGLRGPDDRGGHPYCRPYTIHEILDKAISDLRKNRNEEADAQR